MVPKLKNGQMKEFGCDALIRKLKSNFVKMFLISLPTGVSSARDAVKDF